MKYSLHRSHRFTTAKTKMRNVYSGDFGRIPESVVGYQKGRLDGGVVVVV